MWLFQKILLIQNPEPYLNQQKDSDSAIVIKNATLFWARPASQPDPTPSSANGVTGHKVEEVSKNGASETLPTLRDISLTLPKVCFTTGKDYLGHLDLLKCNTMFSVLSPEGQAAWCVW